MITVFDKKESCCGCTSCKNICPKQAIIMNQDEEGFAYPTIDQTLCIDCRLCRKVCAFQNGYNTSENLDKPEVYALKHKSDGVRKESTSGGAFTAISDYILLKKGAIYGAAYDENFRVFHRRAESEEQRNRFRGSKYVQSDLNDVFAQVKEDLGNNINVLFTGTSCQVAGLNSYLEQARVITEKLITIDLICHGVPSPKIFAEFISFLEKKNRSKVKQYNFRSKANGWGHTEEAVFESGKRDCTSILSQTNKELFYLDLSLRPACHECKYSNFSKPADITIADFWGIENYFPEFKDSLGISAVIVNTNKGKSIFSELGDTVYIMQSNIYDCAARQKNLYNPSPRNPRRNEFWNDYFQHGFEFIIKKYAGYSLKGRTKKLTIKILKNYGLLDIVVKFKHRIKKH